ncbi:MAG: MFS transporter [Gallionella sp.]|nr:MFS transporter [Gallionella sp.]
MPLTLTPKRERYLLLTLSGMQFSHILDFMIMMPLGPILIKEFGISTHEFGFLVASYSFSAALAGLLAATFVDKFERKRLLLIVFALFGLATLACGLSPSYATLLVARGLAGAFGGIMGAMVQTLVGDLIPFERRATASGIISASFSLSTVAGVPVSLWLANHFQWRAPFILIACTTVLFLIIGLKFLPDVRHHLSQAKRAHPFSAMFEVLHDANHLRALVFTMLILFSGFTVIPYITVYAVANVGIAQHDIFYIYLVGGAATLFTSRLIGRWADAAGKVKIYRLMAVCATVPLFAVTHTEAAPLWLWLIFTTLFFVLISGRMIPAMAIITSAATPKLRGTFMSLNSATQQLASGLAATLAGFITTQNATGQIAGYDKVGYVAIAANLLAIAFVTRIVMHDQPAK